MRKKGVNNTVGVIISFLFTCFLIYVIKPYLQSSLNLTNKDSLFIVLLSFSVGGIAVFITNTIENNSQKKN